MASNWAADYDVLIRRAHYQLRITDTRVHDNIGTKASGKMLRMFLTSTNVKFGSFAPPPPPPPPPPCFFCSALDFSWWGWCHQFSQSRRILSIFFPRSFKSRCIKNLKIRTLIRAILISRTSKGNKNWFGKSGVKLQCGGLIEAKPGKTTFGLRFWDYFYDAEAKYFENNPLLTKLEVEPRNRRTETNHETENGTGW